MMTDTEPKLSRKEQILQALAHMLETNPGARITTNSLAKEVGVSEAALYRHFPSKAKMFEGLIEFIEDTIFSRVNKIKEEDSSAISQIEKVTTLTLTFAERNPGMCRILSGDALSGEIDRLRQRVAQFFDRLETQFKQILREAEFKEGKTAIMLEGAAANMFVALIEGKIRQFVRSEFSISPLNHWNDQWVQVSRNLLVSKS